MARRATDATVVIVSRSADAHASAVRDELVARGARCIILDGRTVMSGHAPLSCEPGGTIAVACNGDAGELDAKDVDVIWYRRECAPAEAPDAVIDADVQRVAASATRLALRRFADRATHARLVSSPSATVAAEDKLAQLDGAAAVGLRLPRTLVSNDPGRIRAFCDELGGTVLAKPLGAQFGFTIATATRADLGDDAALAVCPSIYQEIVPGDRHLRICVFGERTVTVALDSPELDWRFEATLPASAVHLPERVARKLRELLEHLDLRMGIIDMKVDRHGGDPYFFEINPQGQFLFLEAFLPGLGLAGTFADFLMDEANAARHSRRTMVAVPT